MALVPSPPLLVPQLTGGGASEADAVRAAALEAAAVLGRSASRWIALGVGERAQTVAPTTRGNFRGYGVDVEVGLSPGSDSGAGFGDLDASMPLAALIAAWLRDRTSTNAVVEARILAEDTAPDASERLGRELRARMDDSGENWGLIVVADGATTLTPKAPGSFDDRAPGQQNAIDDALGTADVHALAQLDREVCRELGVGGVPAWQALAGAVHGLAVVPRTLYRGSPFGVGYFVGTWESVA